MVVNGVRAPVATSILSTCTGDPAVRTRYARESASQPTKISLRDHDVPGLRGPPSNGKSAGVPSAVDTASQRPSGDTDVPVTPSGVIALGGPPLAASSYVRGLWFFSTPMTVIR